MTAAHWEGRSGRGCIFEKNPSLSFWNELTRPPLGWIDLLVFSLSYQSQFIERTFGSAGEWSQQEKPIYDCIPTENKPKHNYNWLIPATTLSNKH